MFPRSTSPHSSVIEKPHKRKFLEGRCINDQRCQQSINESGRGEDRFQREHGCAIAFLLDF